MLMHIQKLEQKIYPSSDQLNIIMAVFLLNLWLRADMTILGMGNQLERFVKILK